MGVSFGSVVKILLLAKRILCLITFLVTVVSLTLPFYQLHYKHEIYNTNGTAKLGEYKSSANLQAWYLYEDVSCDASDDSLCTGQPGSLIDKEGFTFWDFSEHYAMKILYIVCWSLLVVNLVFLIYLIIRNRSSKIEIMANYLLLLISMLSNVIFAWLNQEFFDPCDFSSINLVQNGPCDSFSGSVQINQYTWMSWGPSFGWYFSVIASIFSGVCLFLSIIISS